MVTKVTREIKAEGMDGLIPRRATITQETDGRLSIEVEQRYRGGDWTPVTTWRGSPEEIRDRLADVWLVRDIAPFHRLVADEVGES